MAMVPQTLATDLRPLQTLRARAATDPKAAVRDAAKQFDALFMNELIKSMRAATPTTGLLSGPGSQLGTEMLDGQFAQSLAGLPGGLSDAIARQLERQMGLTPGPIPATGSANNTLAPLGREAEPVKIPQTGAAGFVRQHMDAAQEAEAKTGIPATFMISQAALETGWGRKEVRHADGSPSFNVFCIKAGSNWKGPVAEVMTTEYVNGQPRKVKALFRAYSSYEESFADYAKLMKDNPRYKDVVHAGASASDFAHSLQRAGYATDPAYASKLTGVINTTLRLQRSFA